MTRERKPTEDKYKQVYYEWIQWPDKYTSCFMGLDDYLETEVWKMKKEQRLRKDNNKCQNCGTGMNLNVHHRRYPLVWGEERIEDLITLCDKCHAEVHSEDSKNKNKEI